jgi:hypothetical protein
VIYWGAVGSGFGDPVHRQVMRHFTPCLPTIKVLLPAGTRLVAVDANGAWTPERR